jgi:hypothetical protein
VDCRSGTGGTAPTGKQLDLELSPKTTRPGCAPECELDWASRADGAPPCSPQHSAPAEQPCYAGNRLVAPERPKPTVLPRPQPGATSCRGGDGAAAGSPVPSLHRLVADRRPAPKVPE